MQNTRRNTLFICKMYLKRKESKDFIFFSFQAENDTDREEWMSVLLNSKDGALNQAFQENGKSNNTNQGFLELQRSLVTFIRGLPGNDKCCDCGSNNGMSSLTFS